MKKLLLLTALFVAATFTSCKYDDDDIWNSVHGLENRVAALEELCKQMNTNISSLQTLVNALQNNDYVTGVAPITKNGETVGYTISFTKSAPITIYHGQNGKDGLNGADGKDGHTPVIGVRLGSDGVYYWTLDGEWLLDNSGNKIKAEGKDGTDGKDGKDGANGSDGTDGKPGADGKDGENGKDGADGITPQLKIENGYWFISTDNGATWTNLGKATGENGKDGADGKDGENGKDGKDGDSFFQSVTQDEDNVYFTLANGTKITVPKKSRLAISFDRGTSLLFGAGETKFVNYTIIGGSSKNVVKVELQNYDSNYTLYTTSTSATSGTIKIHAEIPTIPTTNRIIVSVSDGNHTIMAAINVGLRASFDGKTVVVVTPGTLSELIATYDKESITELTVIGNVNNVDDLETLRNLPNLSILDVENTNIGSFPQHYFYQKNSLTSIKLPKMLWYIDYGTFEGCRNLTSISIPDGVISIFVSAFEGCSSLTNVIIGNGVTEIGGSAFSECSSLTNITIPNSVTSIGGSAFSECSSLTNITIPNSVTSIGGSAFSECSSLTNITIPNNITSIDYSTFWNCCSLKSITIPNSVTSIGANAFCGCSSLTNVTLGNSVTSIGRAAFSDCNNLTSINIPNSVTSIGLLAFQNCPNLAVYITNIAKWCAIAIENNFIGINTYNLYLNNTLVESLVIPDSVTSIGEGAFSGCSSLTSVTFPSSMTTIHDRAFIDCRNTTSIYCKTTVPPILGNHVFNNISPLCILYVPIGSKAAYAAAAGWSSFTTIEEIEF